MTVGAVVGCLYSAGACVVDRVVILVGGCCARDTGFSIDVVCFAVAVPVVVVVVVASVGSVLVVTGVVITGVGTAAVVLVTGVGCSSSVDISL